ncbi:hypothetical protein AA103196_0092 [Ameyamaea chiangmaiensis NBRC 103196]|uniref:Uncharacterized protein n=1 Tax=Ameyamaea chiangmaiensis TaxID=442969 RepID=A0A850P547_9PROT|nr:hypothetical protein [Ameyamaea chiangmaiensis]MBS4075949.1 hypothetical protein [Ameyamaea chiangmaiensis]NVN39765.1 hypothetical protein [Ameyamaea chiangmaiensis]GBQ61637.1 hypothetical protein AA103196_0092 [Ameyamaea chiangmaiensis NBRC 103196]
MSDYDEIFGDDQPPSPRPPEPPLKPRPGYWLLIGLSVALVAIWAWLTFVLPPVPKTYLNLCPPGNHTALCPNHLPSPARP